MAGAVTEPSVDKFNHEAADDDTLILEGEEGGDADIRSGSPTAIKKKKKKKKKGRSGFDLRMKWQNLEKVVDQAFNSMFYRSSAGATENAASMSPGGSYYSDANGTPNLTPFLSYQLAESVPLSIDPDLQYLDSIISGFEKSASKSTLSALNGLAVMVNSGSPSPHGSSAFQEDMITFELRNNFQQVIPTTALKSHGTDYFGNDLSPMPVRVDFSPEEQHNHFPLGEENGGGMRMEAEQLRKWHTKSQSPQDDVKTKQARNRLSAKKYRQKYKLKQQKKAEELEKEIRKNRQLQQKKYEMKRVLNWLRPFTMQVVVSKYHCRQPQFCYVLQDSVSHFHPS
ncbi:unnamed protein product [Darwinula stevensoni]|uniref:BZIP domain-containing protein n=1 Tax=Darwinula stevensoni TaxID=69355 RepID=A0A7R9FRY3_9CRUS|nr:unnamed protein product [Darwinula stevensoni]CAG0901839.1 unnamed protein product [Darwinula stevensoni]